MSQELSVVEQQIADFNAINYNEKVIFDLNMSDCWYRYDGEKYYFSFSYNFPSKWWLLDEHIDELSKLSYWPGPDSYAPDNMFFELLEVLLVGIFIPFKQKEQRKAFFDELEKFKNKAPQCYTDAELEFKPTVYKRDEIVVELAKANELLNNAYNINIIPKQFRNIYAVWFVYDYISTSNESLSSAFLHFNLDEIKQKLDVVITQQQDIILNQKMLIAQNEQMMEQNQQMLKSFASIEQNTKRSAQYAQIAANSAEACAWIGVANYISN